MVHKRNVDIQPFVFTAAVHAQFYASKFSGLGAVMSQVGIGTGNQYRMRYDRPYPE